MRMAKAAGEVVTLLPGPMPRTLSKAAYTVTNTVGRVAASTKDSIGGMATTNPAGTTTAGPKQPGASPKTESPTDRLSTPAGHKKRYCYGCRPTSRVVPLDNWPVVYKTGLYLKLGGPYPVTPSEDTSTRCGTIQRLM